MSSEQSLQLFKKAEKVRSTDRDLALSFHLYVAAAEQGHPESQYRLSHFYDAGIGGVTRDVDKSVQWCKRAAHNGHTVAQHNLGTCFLNGTSVKQDREAGLRWWRRAAEQGFKKMHHTPQLPQVHKGTTHEQVQAYKRLATEKQCPSASVLVGLCLENGFGVTKNIQAAMAWYLRAAQQNHRYGQFHSASLLVRHRAGVDQDMEVAVKMYMCAAAAGCQDARFNLGVHYIHGNGGLEKSVDKAMECWEASLDNHHSNSALFRIADGETLDLLPVALDLFQW